MSVRGCAGCESHDDLYLVTSGANGRMRLLCATCRCDNGGSVDISWPVALLTPGTFLELYRLGKTVWDPRMAVGSMFGPGNEWIVTEATDILERHRMGERDIG